MFSASHLRALAFGAALFVPAIALSGCGGGGPTAPTTPTATPKPPTPGATPTPTPVNPTGGGQLLSDDFSSSTLNPAVWSNYTDQQQLQRAFFGARPANLNENGTSFTRLTLDSYNPNHPGDLKHPDGYFRGTEIFTKQSYMVGNGLEAEARLRAPNLPPGLIFAFFLINNRYDGAIVEANYRKDEIDFEGITQQQDQFGGRNRLYTNIWKDWNFFLYGYDANSAPDDASYRDHDDLVYGPSVDPSYDYANWNTYKIRWYPDHTEYYVNDKLERVEREVKPAQAMELHFNFWTPNSDFQQAFNPSLPGPVKSANNPDRKTYNFDVDYVRVRALTAGVGSARLATGAEAAKPLPVSANSYRTR